MAGTSERVEATTRQLFHLSVLTALVSFFAAATTLFAGFAQTKSSYSNEFLFAIAGSGVAAIVVATLQLSKARFERDAIESLVGSKSSLKVDPQATRAIVALEPGAQVRALELLQRLSTNPSEFIDISECLASAPDVFQIRLTEKYRVLWRLNSKEPPEIEVINLVGHPDRKSALQSDYAIHT